MQNMVEDKVCGAYIMENSMKRTLFALFTLLTLLALSCEDKKMLRDSRVVYSGSSAARLEKKIMLEGYVVDSATKKGVRAAAVEIKNANLGIGYYKVETGSGGYFSITDYIPEITYIIEISAAGYVNYRNTLNSTGGGLNFYLNREAIFSGIIRDTADRPLEGVQVRIKRGSYPDETGGSANIFITQTGREGIYSFNKLTEGQYFVTFEKTGYITETANIKKIKSGEEFKLPMLLIKPSTISGKVSIEQLNAAAANLNITLEGRASHSTNTYQDGSYTLEDVKPGTYKMTISHQGFYSLKKENIVIREGDRLKMDFYARPREPRLSVDAYRYTFSPGMKPQFNIRTFRLEKIKVRIYQVPLAVLLPGRVDPNTIDPEKTKMKVFREWDEPVKDFSPWEWRYQGIEFSDALPTGGYCVEINAEKILDRKFFTVTSVGIVVKRTNDSIFAYISNLVTNEPISGASVVVFDNTPKEKKKPPKQNYRNYENENEPGEEGESAGTDPEGERTDNYRDSSSFTMPQRIENLPVKIITKGTTGSEGVFQTKLTAMKYLSVLAIGADGSYSYCSTGAPYLFDSERLKVFAYTDRPVYRAGDTVYYKIIGKLLEARLKADAAATLYYTIKNIDMDEVLSAGDIKTDEWGTYNTSFALDSSCKLGEYAILAGGNPERLVQAGRFYVEQYRKPEFKIDITPAKDYFFNGETAEFRVEAKYLFGAPMRGALVRYRFYETQLPDTEKYRWEDSAAPYSYNRIKLEGEKYSDDNGIAALRISCGTYPYDRTITLEATITDKSNVTITQTIKVNVGRGEYYIRINPGMNFFAGDDKKPVTIKSFSYTNKPVKADLTVQVYRYIWKPWQRVYVHDNRPFFETKVTTDQNGTAFLELPKKFGIYGEFDIVAGGTDRMNNRITASRVILVYDRGGSTPPSRFKNLELSVNSTSLEKAGEITCLVKSRFTDSFVCITLEGRDVYASKVIRMTGNIMPVALNIKAEYAPNLYVVATMQRNRALFTATTGISLPNADTALKIRVTPSRERYKPGEKAKIALDVTDEAGRPAIADLSMAVVDEAIFQIRPDHTPAMKNFFYSKISNWVITNYSFPITLLAGAGKDGKVKVRENFKDTAFWDASIKTGAGGKAGAEFTLPDDLTTWRITVRGHDLGGRVGEVKGSILVTQDLIARIGRPRFMVEGDSLNLIGIVNSNSEKGMPEIATVFRVNNAQMEPLEKQKISLPAFGSARSFYPYTVPLNAESGSLYFEAKAGKESDALKIKVPVESRGTSYTLYGLGDMAVNKTISLKPLSDTGDFEFMPKEITLSVNPSPIAQMLKARLYLEAFPYGCIEQTINKFLPSLAIRELLEKQGMKDMYEDPELEKKIDRGLSKIINAQNEDGSWGWWAGDSGNEYLTSYALFSLYMLKRLGYTVQDTHMDPGISAIERMLKLNSAPDDAKAYMLWIYSLYGKWNKDAEEVLEKIVTDSPYSLSFTIRAMSTAKKIRGLDEKTKKKFEEMIPKYCDKLIAMFKKDSKGLYLEPKSYYVYGWQGGTAEMSAHGLAALLEAGNRSQTVSQLVSSISKRGRAGAWLSTKETANIIFAFCEYLNEFKSDFRSTGSVEFALNGKNIAAISYDDSSIKNPRSLIRRIPVPRDTQKGEFVLTAGGNAGADVSFEATLDGFLYFKDTGFLPFFKSEASGIRDLENGISIARSFHPLTRVRDVNNQEYLIPQNFSKSGGLKVGDEIMVKLRFSTQDDFEYIVLEDYLPSGFEVVNTDAYKNNPYSHSERWDNRMVYFFTKVNKGEVIELAYILRAELPGSFTVRPSHANCMYEPSIQGFSKPAKFEVTAK